MLYPLDCPTKATGEYASRFTKASHIPGQEKVVVRPQASKHMHVHEMLEASDEWIKRVGGVDYRLYARKISPSVAFLKHIRPTDFVGADGKVHFHDICSQEEVSTAI